MANIKFIRNDALNHLDDCIRSNNSEVVNMFFEDSNTALLAYLRETFNGEECFIDSRYLLPDFNLDPNTKGADEIGNLKSVYEKLPLLPAEAADKRLWIGLCIYHCWEYVKQRWNIFAGNSCNRDILSHFLYGHGLRRSHTRNALARLWWIGELTYDDSNPADKLYLAKFVLSDTDYVINLLERNFSNNRKVVCEFIYAISKARQEGYKIKRMEIRECCIHLNLLGGVYMLDAMQPGSIYNKIYAKAKTFGK